MEGVFFWLELLDQEFLFLRRGNDRRVSVACCDEPNPYQGYYECSSYELYG